MAAPTGSKGGAESGQYGTLAEVIAATNIVADSIISVFELANRGDYFVTIADEGSGILLNNGLFANPFGGGGTVLAKLAPDLTYPDGRLTTPFTTITGIDATTGYTTALSAIGKFSISILNLIGLTVSDTLVRLTIDSVVIWDSTVPNGNIVMYLLGDPLRTSQNNYGVSDITYMCEESILLEVSTTIDSDISLTYLIRPIL